MRRVSRISLPKNSQAYLRRRQAKANEEIRKGTLDVQETWRSAAQTKAIQSVRGALKVMAGNRERCMYCSDSAGTDIEHFWPKSAYPCRMFRWPNFLLCCTGCGRDYKGSRFPLENGKPLLVNPTVDDPWDHLDFSPATGALVPRVNLPGGSSPKGEETVSILALDRREAVNRGYERSYRRIKREIEEALLESAPDVPRLLDRLQEADDHGLLGWCFRGNGVDEPPMSALRNQHPPVFQACQQAFRNV